MQYLCPRAGVKWAWPKAYFNLNFWS